MKFVVEIKHIKDIALMKYANASAIILTTPYFSANTLNPNQEAELPNLIAECRRLHVEVFIDVTRMFVDAEMPRLTAFMTQLKQWQVDGIYFADLSVYEVAREIGVDGLCMYQPDTLITSSLDAKLYLELGMKAVSIAKELTFDEVCDIAQANPNQVEVVVHGYPLMTVSKRPLISNYFDEVKYEDQHKPFYWVSEEKRDAKMPIFENEQGTHMFGGYCLQSFQEIKALEKAQVGYARIQSNFLETTMIVSLLAQYHQILSGNIKPAEALAKITQLDDAIVYSSGFYYQKTSAKKEDVA